MASSTCWYAEAAGARVGDELRGSG